MNRELFLRKFGPWAVVTGASDGIGRAFAQQLAELHLNVVLVARRAEKLFALQHELKEKHGVETLVVPADLSTTDGLAALDRATEDLPLGLYVASAGFGTSGPLIHADLGSEHSMLEVNCFATLHSCVRFGNRLKNRGGGGVILMSSLVAWQGTPQAAHYAATKAYVQSLAEALAIEWKPFKIDVLASAPGPVHSGFATRANMQMNAAEQPETVAKASLAALGRKTTVLPGPLTKLLTFSLAPLPRWARARIIGQVTGGMTRHQQVR